MKITDAVRLSERNGWREGDLVIIGHDPELYIDLEPNQWQVVNVDGNYFGKAAVFPDAENDFVIVSRWMMKKKGLLIYLFNNQLAEATADLAVELRDGMVKKGERIKKGGVKIYAEFRKDQCWCPDLDRQIIVG